MGVNRVLVRKIIICLLVAALLYLILGTVLPFIRHKQVSKEYQSEFQEMSFLEEIIGTERIAYVKHNTDALSYRLQMAEEAETEIIMSTFAFYADESGKRLIASLMAAADRGVEVSILVDGISGFTDMRGNEWMQALASHENITVKIYNPVNILKPWKIQTRMHDKYFIIDDTMYLLGGRNSNDLFLGDYISAGRQNTDAEVFIKLDDQSENHSLKQVKDYFYTVWRSEENKDYICKSPEKKKVKEAYRELEQIYTQLAAEYPEIAEKTDWDEKTFPVNKITLLSNPIEANNKEPDLWYALMQLMEDGEKIVAHTPYIVLGKEMYQDLTGLSDQGKDISVIINDAVGGANPFGCTDYLNQKKKVLETGIRVYENLGVGSRHSKIILIDDRISIIGSFNLDMRSAYLDTELMLVIDSKELNALLQEETLVDMAGSKSIADGEEYVYGENYQEKELTFSKKIVYFLLRLIIRPIRHLL